MKLARSSLKSTTSLYLFPSKISLVRLSDQQTNDKLVYLCDKLLIRDEYESGTR